MVGEMFNASKYSMSGDENSFIIGVGSGAAEVKPEAAANPGYETVDVAAEALFYVEEEGNKYLQQEVAINMARRVMEESAHDFSHDSLYNHLPNMNRDVTSGDEELPENIVSLCKAGAGEHVTDCDNVGGKVEKKYDDGPVIGLANERCYHGDRNNYQSKHFSHLGFGEEDDFLFKKQAELFMNSSLEVESHVPINVGDGKGRT